MNTRSDFKKGNILLKVLLPIGFIVLAVCFVSLLMFLKSEPEKKELVKVLPRVEVVALASQSLSLSVESQGTVQARTVTDLTAEVSGVIESVEAKLFAGSFFKKGDVLLTIDNVEYVAALANAKSIRAAAQLAYSQEESLAQQAVLDFKELGRGEPSDLVLRKPQLEKAKADLESAEAAIALAQRNLSKTTVRAPYDGRVQAKLVDVGQTVNARMTQLARIFNVDVAEVRLPISAKESGYINLPESYSDGKTESEPSIVELNSEIGGKVWTWLATLDRVEGVIDVSTRQRYIVARVDNPYGQSSAPEHPPLKVGQYVTATITGKSLGEGFIIPRSALKPNDVVWLIDNEDRLQITPVSVAKAGVDEVYVTAGLKNGDRLCLTQIGIAVDGMEVEVESAPDRSREGAAE